MTRQSGIASTDCDAIAVFFALFFHTPLRSFLISHSSFPIIHNILCLVENFTTRREKNMEKSAFSGNFHLTFADKLVYNITLLGCIRVFAHFYSTTLID